MQNERYFGTEKDKIYERRRNTTIEVPLDDSIYYDYDDTRTGMVTSTGTVSGLENLLTWCRENKITIGAVLMAATSIAIAKVRKSKDLSYVLLIIIKSNFGQLLVIEHFDGGSEQISSSLSIHYH